MQTIRFTEPTSRVNLMVHGQGVVLFETQGDCTLTFLNKDGTDGLTVTLNSKEFLTEHIANKDKYVSQGKNSGLSTKSGSYYWYSLDSQNQRFLAGVGEPRVETACYTYQFDSTDKLWEANKTLLESLVYVTFSESVKPIRLLKDPITLTVPLLLKASSELTMDDVAGSSYLPNSALSPAAQAMYNCVSGKNFVLNTPDFPEFTQAIEYSIKTPGMWCNTRLKQKSTEFGKDPQPLETYLRITLGQNNGESPGIPYVMEIWPVGHYSPIHNHGGANAVIRVLHGSIHVSLFPFLCDDDGGVEPFGEKDFKKDDITWISSTLNQIHKLKNLDTNTDTCITIQCYMYDIGDTKHYDYFDYTGTNGGKNQYEPDSDMDFIEFKKTMRKEWDASPEVKFSRRRNNPMITISRAPPVVPATNQVIQIAPRPADQPVVKPIRVKKQASRPVVPPVVPTPKSIKQLVAPASKPVVQTEPVNMQEVKPVTRLSASDLNFLVHRQKPKF